MSKHVDFQTQWLNDLNRAVPLLQQIRIGEVFGDQDNYAALLRASIEVGVAISQHRKEIAERCSPWFKVTQ